MKDKLLQIQHCLQSSAALLASKTVAAGFDGFVDSIVRVINFKTEDNGPAYFSTIKEFGDYISAKSGSGFSLESQELVQKLGGNMPIMAHAMAQMGTNVNCIGAFGMPAIVPVFMQMHSNCSMYPYTNPGFTTAMEFNDGKIMLARMTDLNNADWNTIKNKIGLETLRDIFKGADLVCLVNWSELDHSNDIWQGLLSDILANNNVTRPGSQFFFDLSDCSKRGAGAIMSAIKLLRQFNLYGEVTLSLNSNEAGIVYKVLTGKPCPADIQDIGNGIFTEIGLGTIIIHSATMSAAWDADGSCRNKPVFIANPSISTGAGDNFNAGYCMARLLSLGTESSLMLANAVSNCYITDGESPDTDRLTRYFSELINAYLYT